MWDRPFLIVSKVEFGKNEHGEKGSMWKNENKTNSEKKKVQSLHAELLEDRLISKNYECEKKWNYLKQNEIKYIIDCHWNMWS